MQSGAAVASAPLAGQTAIVTAGAGAIAEAGARLLLKDGAALLLMGRRLAALEDTRQRLLQDCPGGRIELYAGDACVEEDVKAALQKAHAIAGRLDIIVATVGGGGFKPLLMIETSEFVADLNLNLVSAFLAIRHGAPLMLHGGAIVCISSIAAKMPFAYLTGYHTSKAGLEGLVRAAAEELGPRGIRVNAVRPGLTRSAGTGSMFENPEVLALTVDQCTLGRAGEPADIAPAIRYLAGPEASWVTGQSFAVDGGNELRRNPDLSDMVAKIYGPQAIAAR